MNTKKYEVLEDLNADSLCRQLNLVTPNAYRHSTPKANDSLELLEECHTEM